MQSNDTTIVSNGSKFCGDQPDALETLIERLNRFTLNPFLNTSLLPYSVCSTRRLHVFGNFVEISAVFQVRTADNQDAERLLQAVWDNLNSSRFEAATKAWPCFPYTTLAPPITVPSEAALKYGFLIARRPLIKR